MASTRNKNTLGDYALETLRYQQHEYYTTHLESCGLMRLPGNGLLPAKCPHHLLSGNASDIESALFGIGSTNLVTPKITPSPDIYRLKTLDMCDRSKLIMPEPCEQLKHQRPFPSS